MTRGTTRVNENQPPYCSTKPYVNPHVKAAAVFCSDGRFCSHTIEFIQHELASEPADCVVVPGGPAPLAASINNNPVLDQLVFLIEAHDIQTVLLIAHDDCGYYKARAVTGEALMPKQVEELMTAAENLRQRTPGVHIKAWIASVENTTMCFLPVQV